MGHRHIVVFCLAVATVATASARPARAPAAPSPFDGVWTIEATTRSFFCPMRSKTLQAVVRGGAVVQLTGLPSPRSTGQVDASGGVVITVETIGHTARISGRVQGAQGQGEWTSDSVICANGDWRATATR